MGLFAQRPQDPGAWAALPGEPLEEDAGLPEPPHVDPLGLGGGTTSVRISATPDVGSRDD